MSVNSPMRSTKCVFLKLTDFQMLDVTITAPISKMAIAYQPRYDFFFVASLKPQNI